MPSDMSMNDRAQMSDGVPYPTYMNLSVLVEICSAERSETMLERNDDSL